MYSYNHERAKDSAAFCPELIDSFNRVIAIFVNYLAYNLACET